MLFKRLFINDDCLFDSELVNSVRKLLPSSATYRCSYVFPSVFLYVPRGHSLYWYCFFLYIMDWVREKKSLEVN